MADIPSSFPGINLKPGYSIDIIVAFQTVLQLKPQSTQPKRIFLLRPDDGAAWVDDYYGCVKNGELLLAQHHEPWRLTLRVMFLDVRVSRAKREWVMVDVITPFLAEFIDAMGVNILTAEALELLPPEMVAWLKRDKDKDMPSWIEQIAERLGAPNA